MPRKLPWLWLEGEENEQVASAACGCALHRDWDGIHGDPAFVMCKLHTHAEKLLAVAKDLQEWQAVTGGWESQCWRDLAKILRKISS